MNGGLDEISRAINLVSMPKGGASGNDTAKEDCIQTDPEISNLDLSETVWVEGRVPQAFSNGSSSWSPVLKRKRNCLGGAGSKRCEALCHTKIIQDCSVDLIDKSLWQIEIDFPGPTVPAPGQYPASDE